MKLYLFIIMIAALMACNEGGADKSQQEPENPVDSQQSATHQQSSADFPQKAIEPDSAGSKDSLPLDTSTKRP